jgi:hypothetical protein
MSSDTNHQDLLGLWQRAFEQSMETWKATVPQTAAVMQMWTQAATHSLATWSHIAQQDMGPSEALAQWKKLMDETIENCSKSLADSMATEAFAAAMGRSLELYLNAVAPLRKQLHTVGEEVLRTVNVASRSQVTRLASSVVAVDGRLEALEDRLEAMDERLSAMQEQLTRLLDRLGSEVGTGARPAEVSRGGKGRPQKEVQ